jgi:hypothetical protein
MYWRPGSVSAFASADLSREPFLSASVELFQLALPWFLQVFQELLAAVLLRVLEQDERRRGRELAVEIFWNRKVVEYRALPDASALDVMSQ